MGKALRVSTVSATLLALAVIAPLPASAAVPRCFDERATIVGTRGADTIRGTADADVIVAKAGADTITGLRGADLICGGGGDDDIGGGRGIDVLFGDRGDDVLAGQRGDFNQIFPGPGDDTVDGGPAPGDEVIYLDASGPIVGDLAAGTVTGHGTDTVANVEWLVGGPFADTLSGTDGNDAIFGGRGIDQIDSLGGDDFLAGGGGNDDVDGGGGVDFLDSLFVSFYYPPYNIIEGPIVVDLVAGTATGQGTDTIAGIEGSSGSPGDDVMTGDDGDNEFTGLHQGSDTVDAAGGSDIVDGGRGVDDLAGGPGTDLLGHLDAIGPMTVDLRNLTTSDGDTITGFEDIFGSFFDDTLIGSNAANEIFGIDGADTITGRSGDDVLVGDAGEDSANGNLGTDSCDAETESNCEADPAPERFVGSRRAYRGAVR